MNNESNRGPLRDKNNSSKGPLIIKNIEIKHSNREPLGINAEPKKRNRTLYGYGGSYIVEGSEHTYLTDESGSRYEV